MEKPSSPWRLPPEQVATIEKQQSADGAVAVSFQEIQNRLQSFIAEKKLTAVNVIVAEKQLQIQTSGDFEYWLIHEQAEEMVSYVNELLLSHQLGAIIQLRDDTQRKIITISHT